MNEANVSDLQGLTLKSVTRTDDEIHFRHEDGRCWRMWHNQGCCESVGIEDICGDLSDLEGAPIVLAEEVSNYEGPPPEYPDSYTWTFYRFRTIKGDVTIRWLGKSNGYYSESVYFDLYQDSTS